MSLGDTVVLNGVSFIKTHAIRGVEYMIEEVSPRTLGSVYNATTKEIVQLSTVDFETVLELDMYKGLFRDMFALEQFALDNYDVGGHWVYETFRTKDYLETYREASNDLEATKQKLRETWELWESVYGEMRYE